MPDVRGQDAGGAGAGGCGPDAPGALAVKLGPFTLRTPVLLASGCCGYGPELAGALPMEEIGGFVTKTVTLQPRPGNPAPRVAETASGMLNSIGLENVGLDRFVGEKLPLLRALPPLRLVSLGGYSPGDYATQAERLEGHDGFEGFELNLSCPNVARGGLDLGTDPAQVAGVVRGVRARTGRFLVAKLTPNTHDIVALGRAAQDAGADAVSAINTLVGADVHWKSRTALPSPGAGGLSGPAVRPVAMAMVRRLAGALRIPVIGIGGIMEARDVLGFLLAGAAAVQVGTALFLDPSGAGVRAAALRRALAEIGASSCRDLVGALGQRATLK
ncbi:MAG: dihydroorotate dehydrogenase [Candidatus Eisenbacteria bacterium]|nr:dihydroorotate dehydrogenase [Candidatus Eisenbacteria bacterium]